MALPQPTGPLLISLERDCTLYGARRIVIECRGVSGWLFTYAPLIALCVSALALVASGLSLGWNIYRYVVLKPRLKVTFGIKSVLIEREKHFLSQVGPPLLQLQATNRAPGEVVCNGVAASDRLCIST
jgi:hypothetical protein